VEIPSTRPYFGEEDIQAISDEVGSILRSGQLILGPHTRKLEESFGEYCGVRHAVAVSSGTAALEIALRFFGVTGKEVIIPTNTFVAVGNAVIYGGGVPVLADIKADTLCLDSAELLKRLTPETRGVILVYIAGLPCPEIVKTREICREKGLFLIEDASHAHGASINGQKTGSFGDAGCFSFYPTKVMTTCTGGIITTNDTKLAEYAISVRHHGVGAVLNNVSIGRDLNVIENLGNDWLMDEISALLGIHQLKTLEANIQRRNQIARIYTEGLVDFKEDVQPFNVPPHSRHSYYKFPVLLSENIDKQEFIRKMKADYNITIGSAYDPPCHLQPVYRRLFGFCEGMFPVAEATLAQVACLPMYQQMADHEVDYVLQSLKTVLPSCYVGQLKESFVN
jgi:dTDP-4-amino-4,6-dideoxygalactose transaminase